MYQRTIKGWERVKMWFQVLSPPRVLKLFPPHFFMRDVVLEQVEKWSRKGHRCLLLFFDVKQYGDIRSLYPDHVILQIEDTIIEAFRSVVRKRIADDELLAVQRYYDDDYIVVMKPSARLSTFEELQTWTDAFREDLEKEMAERTAAFLDIPIRFYASFAWIDREPEEDVQLAVQRAMQDARALAKQWLSPRFGNYRAEIRRIVEEEDIRVLAQPIISLSSGVIEGFEILTRGPANTPFANPMDLFHYAHLADMLMPLELLVIKKTLIEIHKKQSPLPMFINVTVPSLINPVFFQKVMGLLKKFPDVKPSQIIFEITERHAIEDFAEFHQYIQEFRNAGFRFAVDDTGAGYASLNMISELLPDVIKIDRSIIQNIDKHEVKDSILQAIMLVANKIGSTVVAEGIETEAEANVLLQNNVMLGQGYFFARPHEPFPELSENWVMKQKGHLV